MKRKRSIWEILSITGLLGALIYTVFYTGAQFFDGVSPFNSFAHPTTVKFITGTLFAIFSFSIYFVFKEYKVRKGTATGAVFLIIANITILLNYTAPIFLTSDGINASTYLDRNIPLSGSTIIGNYINVILILIPIIFTLIALFLIAYELIKTHEHKKLGVFILVCASILLIIAVFPNINLMTTVNLTDIMTITSIYVQQLFYIVLSIYLFFMSKAYLSNQHDDEDKLDENPDPLI